MLDARPLLQSSYRIRENAMTSLMEEALVRSMTNLHHNGMHQTVSLNFETSSVKRAEKTLFWQLTNHHVKRYRYH